MSAACAELLPLKWICHLPDNRRVCRWCHSGLWHSCPIVPAIVLPARSFPAQCHPRVGLGLVLFGMSVTWKKITIEDEEHFVTNCSINQAERRLLYSKISCKVPRFSTLSDFDKFLYLLTNNDPQILTWFGKFVHQSFIARNNIFFPKWLLRGSRRYEDAPHFDRFSWSIVLMPLFCFMYNVILLYFIDTSFMQMYVNCSIFYILYIIYIYYIIIFIYFIYCIYLWFYAYVLCQKWRNKDVQSVRQVPTYST